MLRYEYKVIPAPRRGEKARGVKTTEDRFALALTGVMNTLGAEGWEYIRADTLPVDERSGLTGTKTSFQNLLVFRREVASVAAVVTAPVLVAEPVPATAPRLGPAEAAVSGPAPAVGPAKTDLAAE